MLTFGCGVAILYKQPIAVVQIRRIRYFPYGGIAQLGERLNGIQEVSGSIPLISTKGCTGILQKLALCQGKFFLLSGYPGRFRRHGCSACTRNRKSSRAIPIKIALLLFILLGLMDYSFKDTEALRNPPKRIGTAREENENSAGAGPYALPWDVHWRG